MWDRKFHHQLGYKQRLGTFMVNFTFEGYLLINIDIIFQLRCVFFSDRASCIVHRIS